MMSTFIIFGPIKIIDDIRNKYRQSVESGKVSQIYDVYQLFLFAPVQKVHVV